MNTLVDWALQWRIPPLALADLQQRVLGLDGAAPEYRSDLSEAGVQARVRIAASRAGMRLWRNNVGAFHDAERNIHVRFGLANDSPQVNAVMKSADLIGIRPRTIGPGDVGTLIGQFVSYECKHGAWVYRNDEHERAQLAWLTLVSALGGEARFVTSDQGV